MSPAAKSYLDEFGYADTLKDKTGINDKTRDRDSDNQNKPILKTSAQVLPVNNVTAPTNAEITQAQSTEMSADQILLANKKKGRSETILNQAQGLGDSTANTTKKKLGA